MCGPFLYARMGHRLRPLLRMNARFLLIASAAALFAACTDETPRAPTASGATCEEHADCETPMSYLMRSVCPFTSMCVEGRCAVVCPMVGDDPLPGSDGVACEADRDCTCDEYAADDMGRCACVDGRCVAIVE